MLLHWMYMGWMDVNTSLKHLQTHLIVFWIHKTSRILQLLHWTILAVLLTDLIAYSSFHTDIITIRWRSTCSCTWMLRLRKDCEKTKKCIISFTWQHSHFLAACFILCNVKQNHNFQWDLCATDVFVTKLHKLYCGRWNIAYCRLEMPTVGGIKWVKDVAFIDSKLLIKAVWDNESSPPLRHALH